MVAVHSSALFCLLWCWTSKVQKLITNSRSGVKINEYSSYSNVVIGRAGILVVSCATSDFVHRMYRNGKAYMCYCPFCQYFEFLKGMIHYVLHVSIALRFVCNENL